MRYLLPILSFGVILTNHKVFANSPGFTPDKVFKVCNKAFLDKVMDICGGWVWRSDIPTPQDPFQANGDEGNPSVAELEKAMAGLLKDGMQHLETYNTEHLNHNMKMKDKQTSGGQGRVMQPTRLRDSKRWKIPRGQLPLSEKCCKIGCKYKELADLCEV